MSLTSSMKNLTQEIEYSTKKRKESVSSMINNCKSTRVNNGIEDKKNRLQSVAKLKGDVKNLLSNDCNARKAMSSNTRQSLNIFMNNLKSATTNLLDAFRKEQNLVAADVLGAKAEWAAFQKKK